MNMRTARFLIIVLSFAALLSAQAQRTPHYERVYSLKPREGVFAYARISPDGKRLAYASQIGARPLNQRNWEVNVVDLDKQKILFSQPGTDASGPVTANASSTPAVRASRFRMSKPARHRTRPKHRLSVILSVGLYATATI